MNKNSEMQTFWVELSSILHAVQNGSTDKRFVWVVPSAVQTWIYIYSFRLYTFSLEILEIDILLKPNK